MAKWQRPALSYRRTATTNVLGPFSPYFLPFSTPCCQRALTVAMRGHRRSIVAHAKGASKKTRESEGKKGGKGEERTRAWIHDAGHRWYVCCCLLFPIIGLHLLSFSHTVLQACDQNTQILRRAACRVSAEKSRSKGENKGSKEEAGCQAYPAGFAILVRTLPPVVAVGAPPPFKAYPPRLSPCSAVP